MRFSLATCISMLAWSEARTEDCVSLYFGLGCFWHIQWEFIKAERTLLGRKDDELTAITGYAASKATHQFCYQDGLLHAEVVALVIPNSSVPAFAAEYWKMFVGKDRSHTQDKGPNYRAVIGLPGGMNSPLIPSIEASQKGNIAQSMELRAGSGDDADTLGSAHVWVYDSDTWPFHQAELYHQFHDDYLPGGDYSSSYNALGRNLQCSGRLFTTQCAREKPSSKVDCDEIKLPSGTCSEAILRANNVTFALSNSLAIHPRLVISLLSSTPAIFLLSW
eukprot:TRINITY_DN28640_c0_g1_i1.p1 TRINITY_DN28640_c0_g1~~TRINITY_DN28640_c0_g1_i1.p1  ORF type:complete len:277 (-),score=29.65 TRINITY_DN28640_c0_g1_i1:146-976(-)